MNNNDDDDKNDDDDDNDDNDGCVDADDSDGCDDYSVSTCSRILPSCILHCNFKRYAVIYIMW